MVSIWLCAVWDVLLELTPWLFVGAVLAGALHVLLPVGFVRRNLRGRGAILKAVLVGIPMPLCSCSVIPAGLGLKRDGAGNGASVAFLISTPQTGVDSILVSASLLGWPFALYKVLSAAVLGLVGGWLAKGLPEQGVVAVSDATQDKRPQWREGITHGLELIRMIWGWLLFGVLVSATLTTLVPEGALLSLSQYGTFWAMGLTLIVSVPLYVCATASVPIAAALVAGGFPPGAALVFLMAGPATNVATLGAVGRGFGQKVLAVYLSTIVVGSMTLGALFDFVLTPTAIMPGVHEHHGVFLWVSTAAAVLLVAMMQFFAFDDLRRYLRSSRDSAVPTIEILVEGMTCNGCARKVQDGLSTLDDVETVTVDLQTKKVRVSGGISPAELIRRVVELGFRVQESRDVHTKEG